MSLSAKIWAHPQCNWSVFFITSFGFFFFFWHCALTAKTLTKKAQKVNEMAEGLNPLPTGWAPPKLPGFTATHWAFLPPATRRCCNGRGTHITCSVGNSLVLAFSLPFISQDSHSRDFVEVRAWLGKGAGWESSMYWPALPPSSLSLGMLLLRAVHRVLQQRRGLGGTTPGLFLWSLGWKQLSGAGGGGNWPAFHCPARGPGKQHTVTKRC